MLGLHRVRPLTMSLCQPEGAVSLWAKKPVLALEFFRDLASNSGSIGGKRAPEVFRHDFPCPNGIGF